jgi:GTP-binding protein YchF
MKIALIGRPRSGKTTLFHLLTGVHAETARPEARRGVTTGVARVPDPRVDRLSALFRPRKTTYASFTVVDPAGFGPDPRAGWQTKEFRDADALLHVVRAFADPALDPADPRRDILDLETELVLADLEVVERRLERLAASLKKRRTEAEAREQAVLERLVPVLEGGAPLRALSLEPDEARILRGFTFLSQKPVLHLVNLEEKAVADAGRRLAGYGLEDVAARPRTRVGWASAAIEMEVARLSGEEQTAFLADLGLREPALHRVLADCYALLGLVSFFTVGEDEVRAWPVPAGTRAQDAAGTVHSDMARGFIRAEVVRWEDLVAAGGSFAEVRARGRLRLEGKDYPVQDGDVCHFRFAVGP